MSVHVCVCGVRVCVRACECVHILECLICALYSIHLILKPVSLHLSQTLSVYNHVRLHIELLARQ